MMAKPEQITESNILTVDLDEVVRDQRFKDLDFLPIRKKLLRIQKWLLELDSYDKSILSREDISRTISIRQDLRRLLDNLNTFEIRTTSDTAVQELNNASNQVESLYDSAAQVLTRILAFLREEAAANSGDTQELLKQQKAAAQAEKAYSELAEKLEKKLTSLDNLEVEISSSKGKLVAVGLGKDFDDQSTRYEESAAEWLKLRNLWLASLLVIVVVNVVIYIYLFATHALTWWPNTAPESFFSLPYALAKLTLLAVLSYVIGFYSRNYNIAMGLATTNRHRKNVAETFLNALGAAQLSEDSRSIITREAAAAMFKHLPVGYIHKEHQNDNGPVVEIIKKVTGAD